MHMSRRPSSHLLGFCVSVCASNIIAVDMKALLEGRSSALEQCPLWALRRSNSPLNNPSRTQLKSQRRAAVVAGVELGAVGRERAAVVHVDAISLLGFAVAGYGFCDFDREAVGGGGGGEGEEGGEKEGGQEGEGEGEGGEMHDVYWKKVGQEVGWTCECGCKVPEWKGCDEGRMWLDPISRFGRFHCVRRVDFSVRMKVEIDKFNVYCILSLTLLSPAMLAAFPSYHILPSRNQSL